MYNFMFKIDTKMIKTVFVFVFVFALVRADGESSSSEETLKEYANYIDQKFNTTIVTDIHTLVQNVREKCPDIEEKFDTTYTEVFECIDNIELGSETFCSLTKKNFIKCAEPAKKTVTDCLPEEAKYLPDVALKITRALIDQVCNSTVEELLELLNPCVFEKSFESYESCNNIKESFKEYTTKLPTKTFICKLLPKMRQCVKAHRDASCQNPITKAIALKFYDAVEDATTTDCQEENKAK